MATYNYNNTNNDYGVVAQEIGDLHPGLVEYKFAESRSTNTIHLTTGAGTMISVGSDGFWVRGVKVPQDEKEAETVYNAFKQWLTWANLSRE